MSISTVSFIGRPLLNLAIRRRHDLVFIGNYALPRLISKFFGGVRENDPNWKGKILSSYNWTKRSLPPEIFRFFNVVLVDNGLLAAIFWFEKAEAGAYSDLIDVLVLLCLTSSFSMILDWTRYVAAFTIDTILPNLPPGYNKPKYYMLDIIGPRDYDKTALV